MTFPVLTPNTRAVDDIVSSGSLAFVKEVIVFAAASEGFSKSNTNYTVEESLDRMAATAEKALALGLRVRGSISCVVGSPFEKGVTDPSFVRDIARRMKQAGCYNVALGDTIGVGNPGTVRALLEEVMKDVPVEEIAIHSHDTYGGGVASVIAAVEVRSCGFCSTGRQLLTLTFRPESGSSTLLREDLVVAPVSGADECENRS